MKKILIWLFLLIIVGIAVIYFVRNSLVAWAIEEGGTYALGVETHLGSANLSPGAGSLELKKYEIENPAGYPDDGLMSIDYGILAVNTGSVFADTVAVDSLVLSGIKVNLIQNDDKGNFMEVMNYTRKLDYDTSSGSTMIHINKVSVRDIAIDAKLKIMNSINVDKSFTVEDITLTDVGGDGAPIGQITAIIFQEILNKAVIKGKGQLSDKFGLSMDNLKKNAVEKAGEDAVDKIKDLGSQLLGGDKK